MNFSKAGYGLLELLVPLNGALELTPEELPPGVVAAPDAFVLESVPEALGSLLIVLELFADPLPELY
ncbi:MAG TPA: hypothetical protein VHH88_09710 [Verrucomicrobiae bacterium]|nr:hypothetical protein [Verrucomicrobiae bacterium]